MKSNSNRDNKDFRKTTEFKKINKTNKKNIQVSLKTMKRREQKMKVFFKKDLNKVKSKVRKMKRYLKSRAATTRNKALKMLCQRNSFKNRPQPGCLKVFPVNQNQVGKEVLKRIQNM
jgi:ASC-1-like (ASCH) protein